MPIACRYLQETEEATVKYEIQNGYLRGCFLKIYTYLWRKMSKVAYKLYCYITAELPSSAATLHLIISATYAAFVKLFRLIKKYFACRS